MKRLLTFLCLVALSVPVLAFDSDAPPVSIGILSSPGPRYDGWIEEAVLETLRKELRAQRFDAYLEAASFQELEQNPERGADFYVEIVSDSKTAEYGGVGVSGRHADVTLGMLVSRMAADVRVYRGRTLELLAEESLDRHSKAFVPTSVGVGGRHLFAVIGLAFIERAQVRSVARNAGREMARIVTRAVRGE